MPAVRRAGCSISRSPRESADGFRSVPEAIEGNKLRIRPDSFADHYSQARQFYVSQADVEQTHIQNALIFELSRCEREDIRIRMVSHLLNIDETLALIVAEGLGLPKLPKAAQAKKPTVTDLPPSDALSILKKNPGTLRGRKFGILLGDGARAALLTAITEAATAVGAVVELIGTKIGGAELDDGTIVPVQYKIDGGPSVLFDFPVVLASEPGAEKLAKLPPARDFISDAFAHFKFVAYAPGVVPLLEKAGIIDDLDDGFVELDKAEAVAGYFEELSAIRYWARERAMTALNADLPDAT